MTARELLVTTVKSYTSLNRATDGGMCLYAPTPTSKGCAIGRHLDSEIGKQLDDSWGAIDEVCLRVPEMLPEWMLKIDGSILNMIQRLHDVGFHWDENGITEEGVEFVNKLCVHHNISKLEGDEWKYEEDI